MSYYGQPIYFNGQYTHHRSNYVTCGICSRSYFYTDRCYNCNMTQEGYEAQQTRINRDQSIATHDTIMRMIANKK